DMLTYHQRAQSLTANDVGPPLTVLLGDMWQAGVTDPEAEHVLKVAAKATGTTFGAVWSLWREIRSGVGRKADRPNGFVMPGGYTNADLVLDPRAPLAIAERFARDEFTTEGIRTLVFLRGEPYRWLGPKYQPIAHGEIVAKAYAFMKRAQRLVTTPSGAELQP